MKFDVVARFRETIPTMKLFRHPRSRKILDFYRNYDFTIFQKIGIFWGLTSTDPRVLRCHIGCETRVCA